MLTLPKLNVMPLFSYTVPTVFHHGLGRNYGQRFKDKKGVVVFVRLRDLVVWVDRQAHQEHPRREAVGDLKNAEKNSTIQCDFHPFR